MTEARPTRRDAPPQAATRRDDPGSPGPRPTRRDHPDLSGPQPTRRDLPGEQQEFDTPADTGGLPAPVFERYEPLEGGNIGTGGEAHLVMKVRHREHGTTHVVKLYNSAIRPDPELLTALQGADERHLIKITDWGEHTNRYGTSVSWEVLEYAPGGSLRDLIRNEGPKLPGELVREILVELTGALDHLHTAVSHGASAGLAHRDVKPENILVRERDPLDLVLCDFGLVAEIRATRLSTRRAGTAEYQAPETWWAKSRDAAQDWWSLGVVIAEALIGHNPNAGIMNESLDDDRALFDHLTQHGVDLSEVDDPRWRMLCSGLLTFAPDYRWGSEQVGAWLEDESPAVHSGRFAGAKPRRIAPPIEIAGNACRSPGEIALALSENWVSAARLFGSRDDRLALADWLEDNFTDVDLPKDLFRKDPADRAEASLRAARFVSWVTPELRPGFQGWAADAAGITALAAAAAGGGEAADLLARLDSTHLRVFGRHRCTAHPACATAENGCAVLGSAAGRIDTARHLLEQRAVALRSADVSPGGDLTTAGAALVRTLVDESFAATLRRQVAGDRVAAEVDWWRKLRDEGLEGEQPSRLVALVLASATARRAQAAGAKARAAKKTEASQAREKAREQTRIALRGAATRTRQIGREFAAWLLALVLTAASTFVAVQAVVLGKQIVASPVALAAFTTNLQLRILFPVAVLLACALFRPRDPALAGRRARLIAVGAGVFLAVTTAAGRADLIGFPMEWRTGAEAGLAALNGLLIKSQDGMVVTVVITGLAGLFLANRVAAIARRGTAAGTGRLGTNIKRAAVFVVLALLVLRSGHLLGGWQLPSWLPDPMTTWLSI